MSILPTQSIIVEAVNPKKLFIFAQTKVGKTTALSLLPNNLIVDLEGGSSFINGLKIDVLKIHRETGKPMLNIIGEIVNDIKLVNKAKGSPVYDYISLDTTTALEEVARIYATQLYRLSPLGKNFDGKDVIADLANGAGYDWLRKAFDSIYSSFEGLAGKCLIICGHVKLASINKNGKDLQARDIQLTGKLKGMVCADVDAIGYMYRNLENPNITMLSFKTNELDLSTGARPKHLRQQEFQLLEYNKDLDTFKDNWDQIFVR